MKVTEKQIRDSIYVMLQYINDLWNEYDDGQLDCVIDIINDTFHTAWKIAYRYKLKTECKMLKEYLKNINATLILKGYNEQITFW